MTSWIDGKCAGEESRLDSRQWTHLYPDALDGHHAAILRDLGDLLEEREANGQLMHSASVSHSARLLCAATYRRFERGDVEILHSSEEMH